MSNTVRPLERIFSSPVELLDKVEKDKKALEKALASCDDDEILEALFNFSVGCYHLVDWVKAYHPALKKKVYKLLNQNKYIRACRDLCNASKHINIDLQSRAYKDHPAVINDVEQSATGSTIASPVPPYRLKIQFEDGERSKAENVIEQAFEAWKTFFHENNIS